MDISQFDYNLPKNLIANFPAVPRDHSRLMVIDRKDGQITHHKFFEIENYLGPNDVLVLNKTKVFPARFFANKETGGKIEVLLIEETERGIWKALTKPGLKIGQKISFQGQSFEAVKHDEQTVLLKTDIDKVKLLNLLEKYGHTPLPPYIHSKGTENELRKEYQTVYAKITGSVAAPTAGFHFTKELLDRIKNKGVQIEFVTLHVGLGTFAPVKSKKLEDHPMHFEYFEVEKVVTERLNNAKSAGKRIVSVGTTTTRVLETLAIENYKLKIKNLKGSTNLFIYPPYKFKFVDALITNFHLPKSTLLCLVSALVSYPNTDKKFESFEKSLMGKAYDKAIKNEYRFYSFGDASLII
jgi:S-adenosylmethionine:tRNA ribosyltransferase-isomerase